MTVNDVILNFRAALIAVLPMVDGIGIPWRRGEAYDEWDDLVTCMYKQLVGGLVAALDGPNGETGAGLAPYDMLLPDYRAHATIEVDSDQLGPGRWVFHAFGTDSTPFDCIEVRALTSDGLPCGDVLRTCPVVGSRLSLRLPDGSSITRVRTYSD